MKKIIILGVSILFLTAGCVSAKQAKSLKATLKNYGEAIYGSNGWENGGIKTGTYTTTLRQLGEDYGYDISEFKKEKCNLDKTKIEYVVKTQKKALKTNGEIKVILDC